MFRSRKDIAAAAAAAAQAEAANIALARHIVRTDEELTELRNRCAALEAVVNGHTVALGQINGASA